MPLMKHFMFLLALLLLQSSLSLSGSSQNRFKRQIVFATTTTPGTAGTGSTPSMQTGVTTMGPNMTQNCGCGEHGTCINSKCYCYTGYSGPACSVCNNCSTNACASVPCANGGTCTSAGNVYSCQCRLGFTGTNCANDTTTTIGCGLSCGPNGMCFFNKCLCSAGYIGTACETCLRCNACTSNPCLNGATCALNENMKDTYQCSCKPGYTGATCESELPSTCDSNPCVNGDCIGDSNYHVCICYLGYTGLMCETAITAPPNPCESDPCTPPAKCLNSGSDSYICF